MKYFLIRCHKPNLSIKACALSLILFGGSTVAQASNLSGSHKLKQPQLQLSHTAIATTAYKPGVNRVTFQSQGETLDCEVFAKFFINFLTAMNQRLPQIKEMKNKTQNLLINNLFLQLLPFS